MHCLLASVYLATHITSSGHINLLIPLQKVHRFHSFNLLFNRAFCYASSFWRTYCGTNKDVLDCTVTSNALGWMALGYQSSEGVQRLCFVKAEISMQGSMV